MATTQYQGIRFPDRAESVGDFVGYKTFLEPWEPLASELRKFYEGLAIRREARILAVHGAQGTGKTMFATQLMSDFSRSKSGQVGADPSNLWHRIVGRELDPTLIREADLLSDLLIIEDDPKWVETARNWISGRADRRLVVIADNGERAYFRQGLVDVSDVDFIRLSNDPQLTTIAAQRLVAACRGGRRGILLVVLSNDETFLLELDDAVSAQHAGLISLTQLPVPDSRTKETVVRVNTNRLNPVSYWYCLDKAGPQEKQAVKKALEGASTFPDSFQAVDRAVRSADAARMGRPAKQNLITLVVLTDSDDVTVEDPAAFGQLQRTEVLKEWAALHVFSSRWAPSALGIREASLLESEWSFRLCLLGRPMVASLLEIADHPDQPSGHVEATRGFFEHLKLYHGPGAQGKTRSSYTEHFERLIEAWPAGPSDLSAFWAGGQGRAHIYETALRAVLPGYDTGGDGFLSYRPDFVVNPFKPCSIVTALSEEQMAINAAIRRDAHVFEFTALKTYSSDAVRGYIAGKFANYVEVTQEQ